jgi:SSS family solute:Na+ symporter
MNTLDFAIVAVSLMIVIAVGLWASRRRAQTAEGYFLASGRLPWWIIGSAFVSTSLSSEQMVGTVGAAYDVGMAVVNWEWFSLPVYIVFMTLFVPLYLRTRVTTVADFLERRFGPLCRNVYSWIMLVAYVIVFLVPVIYGGSLALADLIGVRREIVIWTMALFTAAYTVKGGLMSVVWTDAVQCLMLVVGGVALFFYALSSVPGGWSEMVAAAPERFHVYYPPTDQRAPFLGLLLASFGVFLFYQAGNQVMAQRVLAARSVWDGMMGIVFAGFINFLRPLITVFLGFVVYHWIHVMKMDQPLVKPDDTFVYAMTHFTPNWGLRGIVLAGFLAAIMSTLSALANSSATLFSLEIYKKLFNPTAGDRNVVTVGRIASLLSLVVASLLAQSVEGVGIFTYFQTGITYLATPFISVMLMGILWRRTTYAAATVGIIGGFVIQFVLAILLSQNGRDVVAALAQQIGITVNFPHGWWNIHWLYVACIAQVIIMGGVAVVSLFTTPPREEQWRTFLWSPALLKNLSDDKPRAWYQSFWLWSSLYAAIWIGIYAWFW